MGSINRSPEPQVLYQTVIVLRDAGVSLGVGVWQKTL